MRSLFKLYFGKLLNLAGFPALVRECDYESHALNTVVRVKKLELYTMVTVNGIDVYFSRITGTIDGVGSNPGVGCRWDATPRSVDPGEQPDTPVIPAHMRTIVDLNVERKGSVRS